MKQLSYKERNDIPELKFATHSFGVRKTESVKRKNLRDSIETRNSESYETTQRFHFDKAEEVKQTSACYTNQYFIVNPLAYWNEQEIWDYIEENKIEYNPLYDEGFKRVGCIGCPMAGRHRIVEFKRWPKYEQMYKNIAKKIEASLKNTFPDGDLFKWWLSK